MGSPRYEDLKQGDRPSAAVLIGAFAAIALAAVCASSGLAQCDNSYVPIDPVRSFQDLYSNLQGMECTFSANPEASPVDIGSVGITSRHGPLEAIFRPHGEPQPDGTSKVTIYGAKAIIAIHNDRADPATAEFSFQTEITEIRDAAGIVFSKQNAWDNWPVLRLTSSGNDLITLYDVGGATEVTGVIHGSTVNEPGKPSQRCMDGRFLVHIERGCVGVFTIPVMPLSILYVPPPGDQGANTVTLKAGQTSTTRVQTSITTSNSRTVPASYDGGVGTLTSALDAMKGIAKIVPVYGSAISSCLGFVSSSLGSQKGTVETGTLNAEQDGVATTKGGGSVTTLGGSYVGGPYKGTVAEPGLDDQIDILEGVRLAWVSDKDGVKLIPLGPARTEESFPVRILLHDLAILQATAPPPDQAGAQTTPPPASGDPEFPSNPPPGSDKSPKMIPIRDRMLSHARISHSVKDLLGQGDQPITSLSLETIQGLLALDPLAQAVGADRDRILHSGQRYVPVPISTKDGLANVSQLTVNPWENPRDIEIYLQLVTTSGESTTNFTTTIEDDKPGWLGELLSMGPQQRQTIKTSSSIGASTESSSTLTKTFELHVLPDSTDKLVIEAYEDAAFGTFLFHQPQDVYLQTSGVASDGSGTPQADRWVTLTIAGHSYACRTDAQGRYAIYSSNANSASGELRFGSVLRQLRITPEKKLLRAADLRPEGAGEPISNPKQETERKPTPRVVPQTPRQPIRAPKDRVR
jgi:hypothetical protein